MKPMQNLVTLIPIVQIVLNTSRIVAKIAVNAVIKPLRLQKTVAAIAIILLNQRRIIKLPKINSFNWQAGEFYSILWLVFFEDVFWHFLCFCILT
jgi:hypothetical protein